MYLKAFHFKMKNEANVFSVEQTWRLYVLETNSSLEYSNVELWGSGTRRLTRRCCTCAVAAWLSFSSPLAESFLVLMILAAYSWPVQSLTQRRTTEKAPLGDKRTAQRKGETGQPPLELRQHGNGRLSGQTLTCWARGATSTGKMSTCPWSRSPVLLWPSVCWTNPDFS